MARQRDPEVVRARATRAYEAACAIAEKLPGHSVRNRLEDVQLHHAYAEPGYDTPYHGVIATGNWNSVDEYDAESKTRKPVKGGGLVTRLGNVFEALGIDCEWSDEWATCADCGKLMRTEPDSHSWKPSYVEGDGGLFCLECLDPSDHLASLEGQADRGNTIDSIDPSEYGYVKVEDCETGFHVGQDDDPHAIAKRLTDAGATRFLFNVDESEQFAVKWSAWIHEDELTLIETSTDDEKAAAAT